MSSFTTPLRVESVGDNEWKVIEPFTYKIGNVDSNKFVTVPVDYVTDFASIPRILWSILPPWGRYGKAAVIHDYLYSVHCYTEVVGTDVKTVDISRKDADNIFREAMQVLKVNSIVSYGMWKAVRWFGSKAWND